MSAATSATDKVAYAQQLAAKLAAGGKTRTVRLDGLLDAGTLRADDTERQEVGEMVYEEALRCGRVRGVLVPLPPLDAPDSEPIRAYVRFDGAGEAARCVDMMHGRLFDDRTVTADFVTDVEYNRARRGEWFTGSVPDELPPPPPGPGGGGGGAPGGRGGGGLTAGGLPGGSLTGLPTIQL